MKNNILAYRCALRKKIAKLRLKNNLNLETIKLISFYKNELKSYAQNDTNECIKLQTNLTLGKLLNVLNEELKKEESEFKINYPSQTDIERWALKFAVLEFYKNLNIPQDTIIIKDTNQNKTIHEYAPDTSKIYILWLNKLKDLTKRNDVNNFNINKYDENLDRGTPQGGAFEKQLQRYREEFVSKMINS